MDGPRSDSPRLRNAALLTGVVVAVVFVALVWSRLVLTGGPPDLTAETVVGVVVAVGLSATWFVPFLFAVLIVVVGPTRRRVAAGAALVYGVELVLTVGQAVVGGAPVGLRRHRQRSAQSTGGGYSQNDVRVILHTSKYKF